MRKPEQKMWDGIRANFIATGLDPVRIESTSTRSGTPDVNYRDGWVELKCLGEWPKRAGTIVRIDHFTQEQRIWLTRRRTYGGLAFLLLKVGESDWLIFDGLIAADKVGRVNKDELEAICLGRWTRKPKPQELKAILAKS